MRKIRYAVVGLGHISQAAVLPAFEHTRTSELTALVSEDAQKLRVLSKRHDVPYVTDYEGYDLLLATGRADAVYLALPNDLHADYAVRAAKAGVHVLCEKPMAVSEKDCLRMIAAAKAASVKLMIGYRLHFEAASLEALRIARSGAIGDPRIFNSTFSMQVREGNIRVKDARGGGPLNDIGIYCINAARTLFEAEPTEVCALSVRSGDPRFRQIDEAVGATLRFPGSRLAGIVTSFGASDTGHLELVGSRGKLELDPAFEYAEDLTLRVTRKNRTKERRYARRDQFAAELDYFSSCVLEDRDPEPSGEEGLADVRVIQALERSLATGKPVRLAKRGAVRHPSPRQNIRRAPVRRKPAHLHARTPHY